VDFLAGALLIFSAVNRSCIRLLSSSCAVDRSRSACTRPAVAFYKMDGKA